MKEGQELWVENLFKVQTIYDEQEGVWRDILPTDPEPSNFRRGYISRVGKKNIEVMIYVDSYTPKYYCAGKFDKETLIQDNGKYDADYKLHLLIEP